MRHTEFGIIHTAELSIRRLLALAENVANSRATVLISGESGTGKELLARFIHSKSARASQRFFAINCAAVPDGLLESELFGFEKGAFTGAIQSKPGKFEMANQSTFLLDEVSEMPIALQAKLLRVIQECEVERLGGAKPIKVNVRLIATTNRNLKKMVEQGLFREDLYYRLNVIPMEVPPLRERLADIEHLARLFAEISCQDNGKQPKSITRNAMEKLLAWKWPGNVRELQNVMERAVLISEGNEIDSCHIHIADLNPDDLPKPFAPGMTISEAEQELIRKTLEHTGYNRTQAARLLGISVRTLRNKINEYQRRPNHGSII